MIFDVKTDDLPPVEPVRQAGSPARTAWMMASVAGAQ
jgi:hypothetical protein